ncbi:tubulin polyglutamylase ttll6-like isoform X2 [Cimex lectularius]|uniref:Uncharacterized protein n=1 Tax=Cimex lectularius TaxID=79782 RepID=A0A8I6RW91_CIMLE|nr:tubulin polyglutamylase ttll6-like isoform X2 [Cimex lectularius]
MALIVTKDSNKQQTKKDNTSGKLYNAHDYCADCQGELSPMDRSTSTMDLQLNPPLNTKKKRVKKSRVSTICTTNCRYEIIRQTARKLGLKEGSDGWNVYWTDLSISVERCKDMKRFQRINHFPGMLEICRKDLLARNLNRMLKMFPDDYNFFPKTWCLPTDILEIIEYSKTHRQKTYILKPDLGCQGRGIYITKNLKDLKSFERMICQLYVTRPFLIDGYKFDLRVYTLITSCDPLRIFVYNEGLARFATKKYREPNQTNVANMYMHLTNYSVNKHSRTYVVDDIEGSKRRFSTINQWFIKNAYDVDKIWGGIDDVIIKTILVALPTLKHCYQTCFPGHVDSHACFELLGFDFMLDFKLKPYILEVNHSPSFHTDTPIDHEIKEALLMDTFCLLNLAQNDKLKMINEEKKRIRERLTSNKPSTKEREYAEQLLKGKIHWENTHLGNFRKVYPCPGMEKYDLYLNAGKSSLFTETFASRAREVAGKQHREELQEKLAALNRSVAVMKTQKQMNQKEEKPPPKKPPVRQNPFTFEPVAISESEEKERVSSIAKREFLIHSHGLLEKIYDGLKQAGQLRLEDEIKFGRSNQWDINDKFGQMYDSHKKHFNDSITNVLKFISKKSDIKNPDKEQLSSIFLDPPLVQGENIESHLGPFGEQLPIKSNETKEPCDGLVTTDEKANESEDEGKNPIFESIMQFIKQYIPNT